MMLAQVFCVCWLGKFVVVLESNVACEAPLWSCFVVIEMVLYIVLLSCEIGASCWSSVSRMICAVLGYWGLLWDVPSKKFGE